LHSPLRTSDRSAIALAVIVTCQLMMILDVTVVNIALAPIQRSLHFSSSGLAWVVDAYLLTFGGLLLLGGRAGDVFGRRRMLVVGLGLFSAASLAAGLAPSSTWLLIARAIQGAGAALASPSALSLISVIFPEGHARNRALAVFTSVSAGGSTLGLVLGGALISSASWRWVFLINVPVGVAVILLAPRLVPEPPRNGGRLDLTGAILATSGLATIIFAFIEWAERGGPAVIVGSFAAGSILLVAFVTVERRRTQPLFPIRLLAHKPRAAAYMSFLLLPALMSFLLFTLSQYMEDALHFTALQTGIGYFPITFLIFGGSRVAPRLLGRFGARSLLVSGLLCVLGAALWISLASPSQGYLAGLFGPLLLFGLGIGQCFLPLSSTILAGVPRNDAGAASGMLQTMQQSGAALGVASLTTVAAHYGQIAALRTGAGFIVLALLIVLIGIRSPRAAPAPVTEPMVGETREMVPVLARAE
jgi:EmrB/QacA subfamily drug resistance transporter